MSTVTIDASAWPLVDITFEGVIADEDFEAYLDHVDAYPTGDVRYVMIVNASRAYGITTQQRKMQAAWMKRRHREIAANCLGIAFVMTSPIVRGMLTAILWLQPLPCPHYTCSTRAQAQSWCEGKLAEDAGREP